MWPVRMHHNFIAYYIPFIYLTVSSMWSNMLTYFKFDKKKCIDSVAVILKINL